MVLRKQQQGASEAKSEEEASVGRGGSKGGREGVKKSYKIDI